MKSVLLSVTILTATLGISSQPATSYSREIADWRVKHEAELTADDGWLTLVGLFWLKEGENTIGAGPTYDVQLTDNFKQGKFGKIDLHLGKALLTVEDGITATAAGNPVKSLELTSDENSKPNIVAVGTQFFFLIKRGERYAIRLRDTKGENRRNFTHEKWYAADPRFRVKARFERYQPPRDVLIPNVLGENFKMKAPGLLHFTLGGRAMTLEPVIEEDHLFIIFKDLTSKTTTYGAGRFLYANYSPTSNEVIIDFNKAENPPCAFTAFATCPLPPKQNRLEIAIPAGEKRYGNH